MQTQTAMNKPNETRSRAGRRWAVTALLAACLLLTAPSWAQAASLCGYSQADGWQYVELGVYPQTMEGGLEPILWRVLSVDNGQAYLVSEYVLLHHRIHPDDAAYVLSGGAFAETEMYEFLNGAFLDSFSAEERTLFQKDALGGCMTLLSADDLRDRSLGFGTDAARMALGTPYALANGLYQYGRDFGGASPYWTRTQNPNATYGATCTKAGGGLGYIRVVVQNEGCRPACTLRLDALPIQSGWGTRSNPFRLRPV